VKVVIDIKILKNQLDEVVSFEISGHANHSAYGTDIVCAAISTLSQVITYSLHIESNYQIQFTISEEPSMVKCHIPEYPYCTEEERKKYNVLLNALFLGVESITGQYKDYINLEIKGGSKNDN